MSDLIKIFIAIWRYFTPPGPGATEEHISAWRKTNFFIILSVCFLLATAFGWIPYLDPYRHANAEDVDKKIESALEPVNAKLTTIEAAQSTQSGLMARLVKSDISKDIDADKRAWCKAKTASEQQRLRERLDRLQEEYEEIAGPGKRATEPECE